MSKFIFPPTSRRAASAPFPVSSTSFRLDVQLPRCVQRHRARRVSPRDPSTIFTVIALLGLSGRLPRLVQRNRDRRVRPRSIRAISSVMAIAASHRKASALCSISSRSSRLVEPLPHLVQRHLAPCFWSSSCCTVCNVIALFASLREASRIAHEASRRAASSACLTSSRLSRFAARLPRRV